MEILELLGVVYILFPGHIAQGGLGVCVYVCKFAFRDFGFQSMMKRTCTWFLGLNSSLSYTVAQQRNIAEGRVVTQ